MMARQPLVTYEQPPLIEVVIGVQFERLATLDAAHLGLLWGRFRDRFPKSEQKPPLDSAIERLGMRGQVGQARLELLTDVRPRLWFMNESEDELVQVQDLSAETDSSLFPGWPSNRKTSPVSFTWRSSEIKGQVFSCV
ncbi:MAG: TIGR04255 family protein, partial [Burkholderiales bacterium]|nr:TIGR04255 family protein [Burkholderiales bacterium]